MDNHITIILISGIIAICIFLFPNVLKDKLLTMPMIFVIIGVITFNLPIDLPFIDPEHSRFDRKILEYLSEFIIIISLSAIGIKIDRRPSWKSWRVGIYLLGIAMPLTIIMLAALGYYYLGLGVGAAILLGSVLSPTDPVLADNVQVKPPNSGDSHNVRFALTLEAGLNDGLAFPFVYLALIAERDGLDTDTISSWLGYEFFYKIILGLIAGYLMGKVLSVGFFKIADRIEKEQKSEISEGVFLIGATLLTYGITEVVHGYGFLAVFVAAVTARQNRNDHPMHERTYAAIDHVEQTILYIFLFIFGGLLATNGLEGLDWRHVTIATVLIFIIRPLSALISFLFYKNPKREKLVISFFGIRGVGTIYYLAFAHNELNNFSMIDDVWYVATCCIIISIVVHGIAAKIVMPKIENTNQ